mmetsp:Transcript_41207/g.118059  ORF Transcript_41207/g.118059 Transcript_41207/m.118059 type:complete len:278 (+) Transcript_41207:128-961(+)
MPGLSLAPFTATSRSPAKTGRPPPAFQRDTMPPSTTSSTSISAASPGRFRMCRPSRSSGPERSMFTSSASVRTTPWGRNRAITTVGSLAERPDRTSVELFTETMRSPTSMRWVQQLPSSRCRAFHASSGGRSAVTSTAMASEASPPVLRDGGPKSIASCRLSPLSTTVPRMHWTGWAKRLAAMPSEMSPVPFSVLTMAWRLVAMSVLPAASLPDTHTIRSPVCTRRSRSGWHEFHLPMSPASSTSLTLSPAPPDDGKLMPSFSPSALCSATATTGAT